MKKPENHILVIFGASGDLTFRKLIPAVYNLHKQNLLPEKFAVLGASRTEFSDDKFREKMKDGINKFSNYKEDDEKIIDEFLKHLSYFPLDTENPENFNRLKDHLEKLDKKLETNANVIYYLSTPPDLYGVIPTLLGENGLSTTSNGSWKKLIVEKPFGYDLASAIELNKKLSKYFREDQIYRIDHYLGKETVQNILVTRFTNGIFEPLWNRNYVHHVEITSVENIGIENRGGYYDSSGALRDMVQNHLLQLTGLISMEPPSSFDSNSIRNEIVKVFHSLRPLKDKDIETNAIRGQYGSATIKGEKVPGYRDEKGVKPDSRTETYVALKFFIDNWRWGGVPFYIRTGKRLPTRVTEVVIHFKPTPHFLFSQHDEMNSCNQLVLRIQPDEGVLLKIGMKVPGQGFNIQNVNLDFHYADLSNTYLPTAYERLLQDCMIGDSTLYQRADAVEAAWKFVDPILNAWKNDHKIPIYGYPAGTWGPEHADDLIEEKDLKWRYPCKNLANDGIYCEL
jgi:glucose-6-phosphate 1-dehydrogenase